MGFAEIRRCWSDTKSVSPPKTQDTYTAARSVDYEGRRGKRRSACRIVVHRNLLCLDILLQFFVLSLSIFGCFSSLFIFGFFLYSWSWSELTTEPRAVRIASSFTSSFTIDACVLPFLFVYRANVLTVYRSQLDAIFLFVHSKLSISFVFLWQQYDILRKEIFRKSLK